MLGYIQLSGAILVDGKVIGTGYSGHGDGLNAPDMEGCVDIGPIPAGLWAVGPWEALHLHLGPTVARLTPIGHDAHGRTGFFVHGDSASLDHSASHGCIIAGRAIREALRDSGQTQLLVTSGEERMAA